MAWETVYRDSHKTIERDETGAERYTYANPNEDTIRKAARTALADNKTFLGIASPTAAQNTAQVKALTRQVNALIRLALDDFTAAD